MDPPLGGIPDAFRAPEMPRSPSITAPELRLNGQPIDIQVPFVALSDARGIERVVRKDEERMAVRPADQEL